MVKNPPAMQNTWVQPLGQEDPLEKGMATHSSILARGIPWTGEPGGLQSMSGTQTLERQGSMEIRTMSVSSPLYAWCVC